MSAWPHSKERDQSKPLTRAGRALLQFVKDGGVVYSVRSRRAGRLHYVGINRHGGSRAFSAATVVFLEAAGYLTLTPLRSVDAVTPAGLEILTKTDRQGRYKAKSLADLIKELP
jgi:hypothetical protein